METMNGETSEVIGLRVAKVWLGADGILRYTVVLPNAEITLEDVKEIVVAYRKINRGSVRPVLNDIRNVKSVNRAARVYVTSQEAAGLVSATALLVASPVSRMVGNFFLRVNKPPYPTKLFTSEAKAIEWLKGFIE